MVVYQKGDMETLSIYSVGEGGGGGDRIFLHEIKEKNVTTICDRN